MLSSVAWSAQEAETTKAGCDTAGLCTSSCSSNEISTVQRAPPLGRWASQRQHAGKIPFPQIRSIQVQTGRSKISDKIQRSLVWVFWNPSHVWQEKIKAEVVCVSTTERGSSFSFLSWRPSWTPPITTHTHTYTHTHTQTTHIKTRDPQSTTTTTIRRPNRPQQIQELLSSILQQINSCSQHKEKLNINIVKVFLEASTSIWGFLKGCSLKILEPEAITWRDNVFFSPQELRCYWLRLHESWKLIFNRRLRGWCHTSGYSSYTYSLWHGDICVGILIYMYHDWSVLWIMVFKFKIILINKLKFWSTLCLFSCAQRMHTSPRCLWSQQNFTTVVKIKR